MKHDRILSTALQYRLKLPYVVAQDAFKWMMLTKQQSTFAGDVSALDLSMVTLVRRKLIMFPQSHTEQMWVQRRTKLDKLELFHYVPSGTHRLNLLLVLGFISTHTGLSEASCCLNKAPLVNVFVFLENTLAIKIEMGELSSRPLVHSEPVFLCL